MHVETVCPGCHRKLRVDSEHAGKQARCPVCNTVYSVPEVSTSAEPLDPQDQWHLKTPEGQEYGPVTRAILETWISEGRVSDDCQLLCEADRVWRNADEVYPVLGPIKVAVAVDPWQGNRTDFESDGSSTALAPAFRGHVTNAHRGGVILALGILAWAIGCPVFGVLAWVMGSNDLSEMRQGTMDPQGQSLTEAGRMIGMIHTFLFIAALLVGVLVVLGLRII
jgi:hypothetical protein